MHWSYIVLVLSAGLWSQGYVLDTSMAIALPDLREWQPISSTLNPRIFRPSSDVADLSSCQICEDDMYNNLPLEVCWCVLIVLVESVAR
jgi:hypothetical protein